LAYQKTTWEDRVVDEGTGEVLVEGTPINEVNLNKIEEGIYAAHQSAVGVIDGMYGDPDNPPIQEQVTGIPVISFDPDALNIATASLFWAQHNDIAIEAGYFVDADDAGDIVLQIGYSINGGAFTDLAAETITPGAGTAFRKTTLASAIPSADLPAGENWITIRVQRLGADAGDTHSGKFQLANLRLT